MEVDAELVVVVVEPPPAVVVVVLPPPHDPPETTVTVVWTASVRPPPYVIVALTVFAPVVPYDQVWISGPVQESPTEGVQDLVVELPLQEAPPKLQATFDTPARSSTPRSEKLTVSPIFGLVGWKVMLPVT